jgi:hypothetical protein
LIDSKSVSLINVENIVTICSYEDQLCEESFEDIAKLPNSQGTNNRSAIPVNLVPLFEIENQFMPLDCYHGENVSCTEAKFKFFSLEPNGQSVKLSLNFFVDSKNLCEF